jgi:hypothetical protein
MSATMTKRQKHSCVSSRPICSRRWASPYHLSLGGHRPTPPWPSPQVCTKVSLAALRFRRLGDDRPLRLADYHRELRRSKPSAHSPREWPQRPADPRIAGRPQCLLIGRARRSRRRGTSLPMRTHEAHAAFSNGSPKRQCVEHHPPRMIVYNIVCNAGYCYQAGQSG